MNKCWKAITQNQKESKMKATRQAILDKTHYGLNIYAYVLRQYFQGDTVLSLSGRDCKPTKNPFNSDKETLIVKVVDGRAVHEDSDVAVSSGDAFDFAEIHFKLTGQELLDKLNEVLFLRLGEENSFYKKTSSGPSVKLIQIEKKVSPVVSYFRSPVKNIIPTKELSLVEIFNKIKSIAFKTQTDTLRNIQDVKEARKYKAENFSYVTFSGTFTKRNDASLKKHSGLLTVDFDHLNDLQELKKKLLNDEYFNTELLFVSPSGDGLKWVIEIDLLLASHQVFFKAIANYIKQTYDLEVDQSGKDVSRACFLPHDREAYINPKYL